MQDAGLCDHEIFQSYSVASDEFEVYSTNSRIDDTESLSKLYDMGIYGNKELSAPLYDGAKVTIMDALVKYFAWFSEHPGISKEALSDILSMEHREILPPGNKLPPSYTEAMKLVEPYLVQPIVFHVCPNDCLVFRGDYTSLDVCTICGASRYENPGVAAKRFTYLPVGPRLVRMFGTSNLSEIIQAHGLHCTEERACMYDIHDSPAWRLAYSSSGEFGSEYRSISFAFNTDGVNPYSQNRVSYSMWPIILTVLNLPRDIRYSFGNFWLVGTIPGNGTKEPKSLDPYLSILVDELLSITNQLVFDAYQGAPFKLKVDILLHILDYPGIGKVFNVMGANAYQACVWCEIKGHYSSELHKIVYLDNRKFLPHDSKLRRDKSKFPFKNQELEPAPHKREYENLKDVHKAYDSAETKKVAEAVAKSTGCKNTYCFMRLPHHNRLLQTFPDAMHTVKDTIERIFFLLIGKAKLNKIELAEVANGRFGFKSRKRKRGAQKVEKVQHPYVLTKEELKLASARSKTIATPNSDFNPGNIFFRTTSLKSHDWKELVAKNVLKFSLRGMLQSRQRSTLFQLLDVIRKMLSESIDQQSLQDIELELNLALALMERDFPTDIQVITLHLLRHIVDGMKLFGPVYGTWMYAYERFNSWLHRRIMNRRFPEATLMETYRIFEWCNFMKMSGKVVIPNLPEPSNGTEKEVSGDIIQLIHDVYKITNPRYNQLREEYQGEQRPLSIPNVVCVHDRLTIEDENTGRLLTYAPSEDQEQRLSLRNYVQIFSSVPSSSTTSPVFGRIVMCFTHAFAGNTHKLALLDVYPNSQQDSDSSLWWVQVDDYDCSQAVVEISSEYVSAPLYIARDEGKLWFLNSFD